MMPGEIPNFGWPHGADDEPIWNAAWGRSEMSLVREQLAEDNEDDEEDESGKGTE